LTDLEITFSIGFLGSFTGDREVYARAIDMAGNDSGFQQISGLLIRPPLAAVPQYPEGQQPTFALSIAGRGAANPIYQLTVNDADGRYDTTSVLLRIGATKNSACAVRFDLVRRSWSIYDDSGLFTGDPAPNGILSNSQCSVDTTKPVLRTSGRTQS
jgi:hypothetical protein